MSTASWFTGWRRTSWSFRHSDRLRAPTPAGSRDWTASRAFSMVSGGQPQSAARASRGSSSQPF